MHRSLQLLPLLLLAACIDERPKGAEDVVVTPPVDTVTVPAMGGDDIRLVSLVGSGVRFDGVYHYADGGLKYYMRFFERGSAAFVGGMEKQKGQLARMLTIDVPSGWNNVHNCPVTQRNDSLFIRSVGIKGVINYLGEVRAGGDSVRFLKASEITGTRVIAPYVFIPDSELDTLPQQQAP